MQIFQFTKPFCFGEKLVTLRCTSRAKYQYFRNICTFSDTVKIKSKHLETSKKDENVE